MPAYDSTPTVIVSAVGAQGPPGTPGPEGAGLTVTGSVATFMNLPQLPAEEAGLCYLVEDTGHLWSWSGTNWIDLGAAAAGPAGPPGSSGPPGPTGPQGVPGTQ